jgi:arginyl-tRNA synthetase
MMQQTIQDTITKLLAKRFAITDVEPEISYPEAQFGDFATNVAFSLAGRLKRSPQEIAAELAANLTGEDIATAEAVNGFINLRLTMARWISELKLIDPNYGHSASGEGRKVQVEFISANPTGPTTIGNARGGYIGETLSRVLDSQGYAVTREYYFNNAGTQIGKLLESVKAAAGLDVGAEDLQYRGGYIRELATEYKKELQTQSDAELKTLITQAILKRYIEPAIKKMGLSFDVWFNEQDLITDGRFSQTIEKLKAKGLVYEKDGAVWLDTGKLGVAREARVLVKSNGDPTYLAPDIAYHDDIFGQRKFDIAIKVLGADHFDQFPSVKAAVLALHPKAQLELAGFQWLRLMQDGQEVKVSKRLGQFVTIEELIDEVGPDVARFLTLMRSSDTSMDFDLNVAKEQSQKNPLYYVMYSYARAHSILEQASQRGLAPLDSIDRLSDEETALVRQMSRFPELLAQVARDFGVHRLTFFAIELAKLFHDLYESERIIDLDRGQASHRLYLIDRYIIFMQAYFQVMGITPVKRMEHAEPQPD